MRSGGVVAIGRVPFDSRRTIPSGMGKGRSLKAGAGP
jgi:hypothetical protein